MIVAIGIEAYIGKKQKALAKKVKETPLASPESVLEKKKL